jgi:hypothetical protein
LQEEDLFRHTSLFLSLWPHRRLDDGPGVLARGPWIGDYDERLRRAKEAFYPHTSAQAIYSPHVRLLPRRRSDDVCSAHTAAVLTVAAQDVGREPPFQRELLVEKLRTTLYLAATHGHDALVLGAFGCVRSHPPSFC